MDLSLAGGVGLFCFGKFGGGRGVLSFCLMGFRGVRSLFALYL